MESFAFQRESLDAFEVDEDVGVLRDQSEHVGCTRFGTSFAVRPGAVDGDAKV